jgi:hypothetical protein
MTRSSLPSYRAALRHSTLAGAIGVNTSVPRRRRLRVSAVWLLILGTLFVPAGALSTPASAATAR